MCGICGYLSLNHKTHALPETIKRMADSMMHRGPDEYGEYFDRGLGLGFRRLSIIDLKTGSQPMHNEDGSVTVVFNGEIYNYPELRSRLEARHHFVTASDTEVLVHLYEEMGENLVDELSGMFAFAIWDKKREPLS